MHQKLSTTLLLLCTLFIIPTIQFTIEIQPTEKLCFNEQLKVGERLLIGFQVHDGPDFDMAFELRDPSSQVLENLPKSSGSEKTVIAAKEGKHEFCFQNVNHQMPSKLMSFYVIKDDADTVKKSEAITDPLEKELSKLKEGLRAIKEEQQYIVVRERIHRNTAESTNSRVLWWSIFESGVLVAVCLWQVWYLKRFFEVKRSV